MITSRLLRTTLLLILPTAILAGHVTAYSGQAADPGALTLGAHAAFLAGYTKLEDPDGAPTSRTGLYTQHVELLATARIDSQTAAILTVAAPRGSRTVDRVELGEVYLRLGLSPAWQLQGGRFNIAFGRHNQLHVREQPFIDRPLILDRAFGPDGIQEVGLGLRGTLPLPGDAGLTVQIANGDNRRWVNRTDEDLLYVMDVRDALDLGRDLHLQVGSSWAAGRNPTERWTHAVGVDVTLEGWGSTWQTEYVRVAEDLKTRKVTNGGVTSYVRLPVAPRWWAQARYDAYGLPLDADTSGENRVTGLLAYVPSEAASVRFQYSRWRVDARGRGFNQFHFQLNIAIGPRGI